MKNLIQSVQNFGKKAAAISQAVQSVPAQAAALRQAASLTANELQQLRSDVLLNVNGLRASSEATLLQAMADLTQNSSLFQKAGYTLHNLELDLSAGQRLSLLLKKSAPIPASTIQSLLAAESCPLLKSILSALLRAEEVASRITLPAITYDGLIIHVGAAPAVRLSWRATDHPIAQSPPALPPQSHFASPAVPAAASAPISSSAFGSFFEHATLTPSASSLPPSTTETLNPSASLAPTLPPTAPAAPPTPQGNPWSSSSLDRFKKMPNLSKYK